MVSLVDEVCNEFINQLTDETKFALYHSFKNSNLVCFDNLQGSISEQITEASHIIFWHVQHRLLHKMKMSDSEIDKRIYKTSPKTYPYLALGTPRCEGVVYFQE